METGGPVVFVRRGQACSGEALFGWALRRCRRMEPAGQVAGGGDVLVCVRVGLRVERPLLLQSKEHGVSGCLLKSSFTVLIWAWLRNAASHRGNVTYLNLQACGLSVWTGKRHNNKNLFIHLFFVRLQQLQLILEVFTSAHCCSSLVSEQTL